MTQTPDVQKALFVDAMLMLGSVVEGEELTQGAAIVGCIVAGMAVLLGVQQTAEEEAAFTAALVEGISIGFKRREVLDAALAAGAREGMN